MTPEEIVRRVDRLKTERSNMEATYDLIEQYVRPWTGKYFNDVPGENAVDWRSRELYDSTAQVACHQLAASIHGSLTPPLVKWLSLSFRDEDLNEDQEAMEWLEACTDILFQALQESDIHLELNKNYLDLCSWGEGFVFEEEGDEEGKLDFSTPPMKESYFEEGVDGQPMTYFRLMKKPASWWLDKFGDECPQYIREKWERGDIEEKHDIVFATWLRLDRRDADVSKPLAPDLRPWGYGYVDYTKKAWVGKEGGYYERPVFCSRWESTSDSKFAISPAIRALPDILTLNELVKMILSAAEKAIDPPLMADENGVVSDVDTQPGGVTSVRKMDALKPLDTNARFDVSQLVKEDLRESIRQAFHLDDLQLKESPAMTATEVNARIDLMQRILGPTFGYLKSYLLDPLIQRSFNILYRAGRFPDPPPIVASGEAEMDIEYMGTLTRAVRQDQVMSYVGFLQDLAGVAEMFPDALDIPDVDALVRDIAKARNIPADLLRSAKDVEDMRKDRNEMQKETMQLEQAQMAAQSVNQIEQAKAASNAG